MLREADSLSVCTTTSLPNFCQVLIPATRPREIFRGFSALGFLKFLGQFLSALANSGHSERFSPGKIRSEVGRPGGLFKAIGWPTLERILPGENLSE